MSQTSTTDKPIFRHKPDISLQFIKVDISSIRPEGADVGQSHGGKRGLGLVPSQSPFHSSPSSSLTCTCLFSLFITSAIVCLPQVIGEVDKRGAAERSLWKSNSRRSREYIVDDRNVMCLYLAGRHFTNHRALRKTCTHQLAKSQPPTVERKLKHSSLHTHKLLVPRWINNSGHSIKQDR